MVKLLRLAVASAIGMVTAPRYPREIRRAVRTVGAPMAALPVIMLMATIGAIAGLQGVSVLRMFGAERLLSGMLVQVMIRDLAPTMTALMMAAQVGTAMAGEIGAMSVDDEVAALRAMSTDPVRFLVVPRLLACALVAPVFTGLGAVSSLWAGFVGAVYLQGGSPGPFVAGVMSQLDAGIVGEAALKGVIFGYLCTLLACYHGLEARNGSEGVGAAVNATIVQSIILVAGAEAFLTMALMRVLA